MQNVQPAENHHALPYKASVWHRNKNWRSYETQALRCKPV